MSIYVTLGNGDVVNLDAVVLVGNPDDEFYVDTATTVNGRSITDEECGMLMYDYLEVFKEMYYRDRLVYLNLE